MKEDTIYNLFLATSILGVIMIMLFVFTNQSPETFTELYFEDHQDLPSEISLGEDSSFSFSIHNLEQETVTYEYLIYIVIDGEEEEIALSSVILKSEQTATITQSFSISDEFESAQVIVEANGQEIYFWLIMEEEE